MCARVQCHRQTFSYFQNFNMQSEKQLKSILKLRRRRRMYWTYFPKELFTHEKREWNLRRKVETTTFSWNPFSTGFLSLPLFSSWQFDFKLDFILALQFCFCCCCCCFHTLLFLSENHNLIARLCAKTCEWQFAAAKHLLITLREQTNS